MGERTRVRSLARPGPRLRVLREQPGACGRSRPAAGPQAQGRCSLSLLHALRRTWRPGAPEPRVRATGTLGPARLPGRRGWPGQPWRGRGACRGGGLSPSSGAGRGRSSGRCSLRPGPHPPRKGQERPRPLIGHLQLTGAPLASAPVPCLHAQPDGVTCVSSWVGAGRGWGASSGPQATGAGLPLPHSATRAQARGQAPQALPGRPRHGLGWARELSTQGCLGSAGTRSTALVFLGCYWEVLGSCSDELVVLLTPWVILRSVGYSGRRGGAGPGDPSAEHRVR